MTVEPRYDPVVHQNLRLQIMAALASGPGEPLEFRRLKAITRATDGNLGAQLTTLAEAGYVSIAKDFHQNRPRTRAELTEAGRAAFDGHVAYLKSLLP